MKTLFTALTLLVAVALVPGVAADETVSTDSGACLIGQLVCVSDDWHCHQQFCHRFTVCVINDQVCI